MFSTNIANSDHVRLECSAASEVKVTAMNGLVWINGVLLGGGNAQDSAASSSEATFILAHNDRVNLGGKSRHSF